MNHITQDQADAIAIQSEATYHQANQFWILTNSELVNVCNAAIQHYIETCINQLTGISYAVPAQPEPINESSELPGMWDASDFLGGATDMVAAQPEPVEMRRENIKLLTDKYAAACSSFARKIALKGRDDSMSPLAVEAGDLRAELHAAIDAMAQPEQVELTDEQIKELLPYSWPWGIEVVRSILAAAKGGAL